MRFTVTGARNLPALDAATSVGGYSLVKASSDPYVVVSWAGQDLAKSRVQYRTCAPAWQLKVKFTLSRAEWDAAVEDFNLCEDPPVDSWADQDPPPTLLEHLEMLFQAHDADGSGELEWDEFWQVLADLNLGLSDEDVGAWQAWADADGSGSVRWGAFKGLGDPLLGRLSGAATAHDGWATEALGLHPLHHARTGRAFTLDQNSGATAWVPTPAERRAAGREVAARAQDARQGPPLVLKVVDYDVVGAHDVMGVAVVPFADVLEGCLADPTAVAQAQQHAEQALGAHRRHRGGTAARAGAAGAAGPRHARAHQRKSYVRIGDL